MVKDGVCEMERQNKKGSHARKSGRNKNNIETNKKIEEKKLAGPLAKKELPAEGCPRRKFEAEEIRETTL